MQNHIKNHIQELFALIVCVIGVGWGIAKSQQQQHTVATYTEHVSHHVKHLSRYATAEKYGLKRGHPMTMPSANGVYYVYVTKGTAAFRDSVIDVIDNWILRTDIPFRSTQSAKKANIVITQKKGKVDKDESKNIATLGITMITDGTLKKRTHIYISKKACYECEVHASQVVEHEMGHALGLDHVSSKKDVINSIVTNKSHITQRDTKTANSNYYAVKKLV